MAITASVVRGYTFATGVSVDAASLNSLGEPTVSVATPIAVGNGGTNATTASAARTNLGIGTIATQASNAVALTGGAISGTKITLQSYACLPLFLLAQDIKENGIKEPILIKDGKVADGVHRMFALWLLNHEADVPTKDLDA